LDKIEHLAGTPANYLEEFTWEKSPILKEGKFTKLGKPLLMGGF